MSVVISRIFYEKKKKKLQNCKIANFFKKFQKFRQITACDVLKLTVMIITGNFGPLLEVL
jgi:hypothetical protein